MALDISKRNKNILSSKELKPVFYFKIDGVNEYKEVANRFCEGDLVFCENELFFCKPRIEKVYANDIVFSSGCLSSVPSFCDGFVFCEDDLVFCKSEKLKNQKCLIDLDGETSKTLSWSLKLESGSTSTVGNIKVELVDKDEILTRILSPESENGDIMGNIAEFGVAFCGDYSDRIPLFKGFVNGIKSKLGSVTISVTQANQFLRSKYFSTPEDARTTQAINSTSLSVTTEGLGELLTDDDFVSVYARIEDEVFKIDSVSGNTLNFSSRGEFDTISVSHDEESSISIYYRLKGNPLDVALYLMTEVSGITEDLIDLEQFNYLKNFILIALPEFDYMIDSEIEIKKFIEDEIYRPLNVYSIPRSSGKISIGYSLPPLRSEDTKSLECCNVVNPDKLFIERTLTSNFYNVVTHKFGWDIIEEKFTLGEIRYSQESKNRIEYKNTYLDIEARGYGEDARDWFFYQSSRLTKRYRYGAETVKGIQTHFGDGLQIEVGDIVEFGKDLKQADYRNMSRKFEPRLMEVTNKKADFVSGKITLDIMSSDYDERARYGVISPPELANEIDGQVCFLPLSYDNATDDQKDFYNFISPSIYGVSVSGSVVTFDVSFLSKVENAKFISIHDDCLNGISEEIEVLSVSGNKVYLKSPPTRQGSGFIMTVNGFSDGGYAYKII